MRGAVGQLQVGRHAPGGGGRGHATQGGGAPQGVLPATRRVEVTAGVLEHRIVRLESDQTFTLESPERLESQSHVAKPRFS